MSEPIRVQYITCVNDGAFIMSFDIRGILWPGGPPIRIQNVETGTFDLAGHGTIDLSTLGFREDTPVQPFAHIRGGSDPTPKDHQTGADEWVYYAPNGENATYNVTGTTLSNSIDRLGS